MESQSTDSPANADTTEAVAGPRLVLTATTAQRVNFASAQNGVGVLKAISLRNDGDMAIEGILVALSCKPPVLRPK